jgi:hypothetical protein
VFHIYDEIYLPVVCYYVKQKCKFKKYLKMFREGSLK